MLNETDLSAIYLWLHDDHLELYYIKKKEQVKEKTRKNKKKAMTRLLLF